MNVLNSYLMMPLIKLFGMNPWTIRLPQAILSCVCIIVIFMLVKELFGNECIASLSAFLLAINPWHIMMTRNNIESGLLPTFFLLGLFFFVKGLKRSRWFYASAVCYGLSLYSYATIWPVLPFVILIQAIYGVCNKKINLKDFNVWCSVFVLGIMACPLILFLLINAGVMPEIKSAFISIPRLVEMRSDDFGFHHMLDNLLYVLNMLDTQQDGLVMNSTKEFGLYYRFSNVFMIIGILLLAKYVIEAFRKKKFDLRVFVFIQLAAIFLLGILIHNPHATRINCIHFFIIISIALGIYELSEHYLSEFKYFMLGIYTLAFVGFVLFYKKEYNITVQQLYIRDLGYCFEDAENMDKDVYVDDRISYSNILYYTKMPVNEFINTVKYDNYPDPYLNAVELGKYHRVRAMTDDKRHIAVEDIYVGDYIYIVDVDRSDELKQKGYDVSCYGSYCVAVKAF